MAPDKYILLLPSLPNPLRRSSFRSAYKPTLSHLLPLLIRNSVLRLDIALVLDESYDTTKSRGTLFPALQSLLQETYALVCLVAAQKKIDLDLPGGIDVRVLFITPPSESDTLSPLSGPLISLPTFASSLNPTSTHIFVPESEPSLPHATTFSTHFKSIHSSSPTITHLPSGPGITLLPSSSTTPSTSTTTIHKSIANGGTFDHLHIGHKLLLTCTLLPASPFPTQPSRKITIGVTDAALLANKKHSSVLEPWSKRVSRTAEFVESILCLSPSPHRYRTIDEIDDPDAKVNGRITRYTYTPLPPTTSQGMARGEMESSIVINYTLITDPFGPTITDPDITAIVVSAETRSGGKAVNDKRREKGWNELEVFEVGVLDATPGDGDDDDKADGVEGGEKVEKGFADKISSTEIRRRLVEMEKQGKL